MANVYIERAMMLVNSDKTVSTFCPIVLRNVVMVVESYSSDFIVLKVHNYRKVHLSERFLIVNGDNVTLYSLFDDRSIPLHNMDLSLNRYHSFNVIRDTILMLYDECYV